MANVMGLQWGVRSIADVQGASCCRCGPASSSSPTSSFGSNTPAPVFSRVKDKLTARQQRNLRKDVNILVTKLREQGSYGTGTKHVKRSGQCRSFLLKGNGVQTPKPTRVMARIEGMEKTEEATIESFRAALSRRTASSGRVGVFETKGNLSVASFNLARVNDVLRRRKTAKVDLAKLISQALPVVVLASAVVALSHPPSFIWFTKQYYTPALGGIMLSIGVQLSVQDFALVFKRPLPVLIGYIAQYMVKPLLGYATCLLFKVPPDFAAGLCLTASVAGAQLSSYAAFLSEGDVALAIVLTSITTMTSVLVTPMLTKLLIGAVVPVDMGAMALSIGQVVLVPVLLGLFLNTFAKKAVDRVRPFVPLVGMVCTSLCIGSPLAINRAMLLCPAGLRLLLPVFAFHALSFTAGYWLAKLPVFKLDERTSRTLSLCTGMQSSTLAMLLATNFLGPTAAVSPACSVVFMALMGLSLGSFWGRSMKASDLLTGISAGLRHIVKGPERANDGNMHQVYAY